MAALEPWPESGIPDKPGAWLMATAKRRGIDALRRRIALERKHELIAHEQRDPPAARPARPRRPGRRRRGRRAAADLHDLPPGPVTGRARRADPAPARRAHDAGDRPRLPGLRGHGGAAHRAGQAHAVGGARALRGARARRARRPSLRGARGDLPRLQRGLRSHRRRALDPTAAVRGRAAPGPHPRRADAGRARGARAAGADGAAGLAAARARVGPGGEPVLLPTRTALAGTVCSSSAGWPRWGGPRSSPARSGRTRCRRRSRPATRAPAAWRTPTGRASSRSTTGWRR